MVAEYEFPIDEEGVESLSSTKLIVTMPLIFPRPRKPLQTGEALLALQHRGMLIENDVMTLVTWGGSVFNGYGGIVKTLRRINDIWEVDFIVKTDMQGNYCKWNQKLVDAITELKHLDEFVCAPNGGQDEETLKLEINSFMLLPKEALEEQEVFNQPHDG